MTKELTLRVTDLEKENAGLRAFKEKCKFNISDIFKDIETEKQLTKAKEHIENLLYYVKQCTCERSNYVEIEKDIKEAEQFLKEE